MRVYYIQHEPFVGPANALAWAAARGHSLAGTHIYRGEPLAEVASYDMLIVPGGTMSVYEESEFPRLVAEKRLVEQTLAAQKPVLGLCFGAQMLAEVLGARVYRNREREFGWWPVRLTDAAREAQAFSVLPESFSAFNWHADAFDLPKGCLSLAESNATPNQAFEYGGLAFAAQFHLEASEACVRALLDHAGHQLESGPYVQQAAEMLPATAALAETERLLFAVMDRIAQTIDG